jgi:CheY-like chemotaxis protein
MTQARKILIVDDDPVDLRRMQSILKGAGFTVMTAADGDEALKFLQRQPIDLVLADGVMPNMDGYQLHETMRANPCWDLIPFVLLSGLIHPRHLRAGKESGADDFLIKPVEANMLLSVVRGKLRRIEQLREQLL